ncbi:MAG: hypothetical protein HPY85_06720 [Anaerolineae bacterium]|nr:hypothetical protein [Anaerolineae bacterium]
MNTVRVIVSGPAATLMAVREGLAQVLAEHGLDVTEKGVPRPGKGGFDVMYLTGKALPMVADDCELHYVDLEEAA